MIEVPLTKGPSPRIGPPFHYLNRGNPTVSLQGSLAQLPPQRTAIGP
jgi:hypothetical protein